MKIKEIVLLKFETLFFMEYLMRPSLTQAGPQAN